jgi:hypothetical protein
MNILQHRAAAAMEKITAARTPQEHHDARQEGFAVKTDLEKFISGDQALRAFKAARPKSAVGMYKGGPRFVFMVPADGKTQTAPVTLPDGSRIIPIQNQIPVPENMVDAMVARGWVRMNSVLTDLSTALGMSDPARPNNT